MNYYEQFYDDLELEPEDGYYRNRDPYYYHPREDYYTADPYREPHHMDDLYEQNEPYHRQIDYHREQERDWYRHDTDLPEYRRQSDHVEYGISRGMQWSGRWPSRGQSHNLPNRGCGRINRNARNNRGRGNGAHNSDRGRGNIERGRGIGDRGRGSFDRGHGSTIRGHGSNLVPMESVKGRIKAMTFVKAGDTNDASNAEITENKNSAETNASDTTIRFDYKSFQNEPSQEEQEVEQALNAYKCQLGFGYGYGPRADLVDGEQPEWLVAAEDDSTTADSFTLETNHQTSEPVIQTEDKAVAQKNVKTAMVNPAFNFVKAKSEFHSIDVAFHETEKVAENQPTPNSLSVNFGNKRVGLGFGVSASKTDSTSQNVSDKLYAGMKGGNNFLIDAKFARLQEAVKVRNLPNKNGIEILHMAVDKVKMIINDDISSIGRAQNGQVMFLCKLFIDGVYIAQGQATAKKSAKHEAYHNALQVFSNESLTVKEVSKDVFELRPKDPEFKVPSTIGMPGQKQDSQLPTANKPSKASNTVSISAAGNTARESGQTTYTKPKIIFHQPSHPLNNKPLDFQERENNTAQQAQRGSKTAEALAMKLLKFVKESQEESQDDSDSKAGITSESCLQRMPTSTAMSNPRKRPTQALNVRKIIPKKTRRSDNCQTLEDLSDFILVVDSHSSHGNNKLPDVEILRNSANFNKVVLKLEYEDSADDVSCSLVLADIVVSISHGATKEEAKLNAAKEALEYLCQCCYTIKRKQLVDSEAAGVTKEQLLSDIQNSKGANPNAVIPDSNIGNLLLRKMGWIGGGVGKDGKGIEEPVKAEMVIGREGLGLRAEKGIEKNFSEKVTKLLQDYVKSNDQYDLHFSSELSKEERAIIHKIGTKFGLKTQSKGSKIGNDRFLIVSRKRSAKELLEHVRESGGSTSKYELIPPSNTDFHGTSTRREDISHGHYKQ